MTSHPPPLNRENFRAYPRAKMAANLEMEALRLQNDALKAENARLHLQVRRHLRAQRIRSEILADVAKIWVTS